MAVFREYGRNRENEKKKIKREEQRNEHRHPGIHSYQPGSVHHLPLLEKVRKAHAPGRQPYEGAAG